MVRKQHRTTGTPVSHPATHLVRTDRNPLVAFPFPPPEFAGATFAETTKDDLPGALRPIRDKLDIAPMKANLPAFRFQRFRSGEPWPADHPPQLRNMTSRRFRLDWYATAWGLPMVLWQVLFFVIPLGFLVYLSFWLVRNYRMVPGFDVVNWVSMYGKDYFWDAYGLTLGLAAASTLVTSLVAFPCAYALAFKVSDTIRRWAIFFLIIPFFTSYLVRIYAWQVIIAEHGVVNAALVHLGFDPFIMLNTKVGTLIGYLTLCLPLVVILQTFSLAAVDRTLIEAAHNLGCGRIRTVFTVIVPLAKVGLIIGAVFCFILSFGDFVSPYYLGGSRPPTLSILIIDTTKSGQQWPKAAVVAVTMIATLLVVAFAAVSAAYRKRT